MKATQERVALLRNAADHYCSKTSYDRYDELRRMAEEMEAQLPKPPEPLRFMAMPIYPDMPRNVAVVRFNRALTDADRDELVRKFTEIFP